MKADQPLKSNKINNGIPEKGPKPLVVKTYPLATSIIL
jgi:hypothetical protein